MQVYLWISTDANYFMLSLVNQQRVYESAAFICYAIQTQLFITSKNLIKREA